MIIDDASKKPIRFAFEDPRIRIVFSSNQNVLSFLKIEKRLGLIRARILGGDESRGDFLAFIDAHVRVAPDWLYEPYQLLSQHPHSIVNFINFNLDPKTFIPYNIHKGIGR